MLVECYFRVTAQKSGYGDIKHHRYFKPTDLRISKTKPATGSSEIAIKLNLEIPNSLFIKPALNFKMSIPEEACALPVLEADVQNNLAEVLAEQLGQKIHLSVSSDSELIGEEHY